MPARVVAAVAPGERRGLTTFPAEVRSARGRWLTEARARGWLDLIAAGLDQQGGFAQRLFPLPVHGLKEHTRRPCTASLGAPPIEPRAVQAGLSE